MGGNEGNAMDYETLFFLKDIIIVLLIFAIVMAMNKIRVLKETLAIEKRKQSMPLITMNVDTKNDIGVFLINDSYCYAKNINIEDMDVTVDYGFKKHLTLKFPPLEILKPGAQMKLNYRVFDEEYDVTATDSVNILNHFSDAPTEMRLRYQNIEGNPFTARIVS